MRKRDLQLHALLLSAGVTSAAAVLGAAGAADATAFYAALDKPAWAPRADVFGPVWATLYVLMAVAAWLAWRAAGFMTARVPLALHLAQLVLNALWSWIFFRGHLGRWAFFEINLLWLLLMLTVVRFWRCRPLAGILLLPYWAWVSFAAALAYALWQRNPAQL